MLLSFIPHMASLLRPGRPSLILRGNGAETRGVIVLASRHTLNPSPPVNPYVAAVLASNPVGFWKMDEASGMPQDSSGNGNHMTALSAGTPDYQQAGPFSGAYGIRLQGGENFRRLAPVSTVTNNFSLEMFYLWEAAGGNDRLFYNGDFDSDPGWGIDYQSGGSKIRALYGGVAWEAESTFTVDNGPPVWHHIIIVRDAGTTKYYVNGALDTANAGTNTPNTPTTATFIGSTSLVTGTYSMCAIYSTALSAADAAAHYAASGL